MLQLLKGLSSEISVYNQNSTFWKKNEYQKLKIQILLKFFKNLSAKYYIPEWDMFVYPISFTA